MEGHPIWTWFRYLNLCQMLGLSRSWEVQQAGTKQRVNRIYAKNWRQTKYDSFKTITIIPQKLFSNRERPRSNISIPFFSKVVIWVYPQKNFQPFPKYGIYPRNKFYCRVPPYHRLLRRRYLLAIHPHCPQPKVPTTGTIWRWFPSFLRLFHNLQEYTQKIKYRPLRPHLCKVRGWRILVGL